MRILLIEDDPHISDVIQRGLSERGMSVKIATDGQMGFELGRRNEADIIILDLKLPKLEGTTVCTMLREHGIATPILMLTALGTSNDIELAYAHGANDYLVKPFDFTVLISRIRLLARLSDDVTATIVNAGNVAIDLTRRAVTREGSRVGISDMEFSILECLVRHRGDIVPRTMLCEALGNIRIDTRSTMIDTLVGVLTRKLHSPGTPDLIEIIPDEGYRFLSD